MPLVVMKSVDDPPALIVDGCAIGPEAIGVQVTVTVTAGLSDVGAHWPVTRTQYDVVVVGLTTVEDPVAPVICVVVFPELPTYH